MKIYQNIIFSNVLMLLIPFIAIQNSFFSNQVQIFYQIQQSTESFQKNHSIAVSSVKKLSIFQRYVISHLQFDGLQFFTNKYEYQPNFAFMKGYTTVIQIISHFSRQAFINFNLQQLFSIKQIIFTLSLLILLNKVFFILSIIKLKRIASKILEKEQEANKVTLLFIYNPACIFYHSIYSQSIYAFITFSAINLLLSQDQNQKFIKLKALLLLSVGVTCRSNGIFLLTMVGFPIIYQLWLKIKEKLLIQALYVILQGLIFLIIVIFPFITYQYFITQNLCEYQEKKELNFELQNQCNKLLPDMYSYIQKKYWAVGFLSYFKLSNILFIVIGAPSIILSLYALLNNFMNKQIQNKLKPLSQQNLSIMGLYVSFLILSLITIIFTNIQSSTRFFSSHPIFYLILLKYQHNGIFKLWRNFYYFFGTILFCIGFPWT